MPVKPPQLRLLVGLALLMTAEPAVAKVAVATALTVVLTQHVETHTTSTAVKSRKLVEERVFPFLGVIHTVGNDLWSFAGKLIPKIKFDELYMRNYRVDLKQYLDYVPIAEAIDKLLEKTEDVETLFCSPLVLIWFGTRSADDQKLAINLLAAKLRENARTKFRLLTIFQRGKEEDNGHFRGLAAAVEKRCLIDMATDEMYKALELPSNLNNEEFVKLGGLSIWKRFGELGNEVFSALMLTIMRERSQDEIMWAGVIYKLRNDKKMEFSLSGVFDGLLRSYDADAGDYRPSEGVQFLRSPELMDVFNDVTLTGKEAGTAALKKLLERSKDELMWARLIYMLQTDESVPTIPSDVFDALLQPYDIASYGQHQCTPSQAVEYLLGSEFFELYSSKLLTSNDIHELLLTELRTRSLDELMWAKLLYMLQNDESVFSPFSSVLETLVKSWTVAVQSTAEIVLAFEKHCALVR